MIKQILKFDPTTTKTTTIKSLIGPRWLAVKNLQKKDFIFSIRRVWKVQKFVGGGSNTGTFPESTSFVSPHTVILEYFNIKE